MRLEVVADPDALAGAAAVLLRARVEAKPDLAVAMPAGRTPRRMYERLRALQAEAPLDYSRVRVFAVDELCPPAPSEGYFWRQIQREFLAWAGVPAGSCHPYRVDADDVAAMCRAYEQVIAGVGGLDLVMLGLGPNAHLASNEPGTPLGSVTRPVRLLPDTVGYILTDAVNVASSGRHMGDRAVTLGLATILAAREVVVLVSGAAKRPAVQQLLRAPIGPEVPATVLREHPCCTILADRAAIP
jgi:glucosamine-6-phosphate deaminase